jgi:hypothetical protein
MYYVGITGLKIKFSVHKQILGNFKVKYAIQVFESSVKKMPVINLSIIHPLNRKIISLIKMRLTGIPSELMVILKHF